MKYQSNRPSRNGGISGDSKRKYALIAAVVFLVAAVLFFSFQLSALLGGQPQPAASGDIGNQMAGAKNALESISKELDSIAKLI